MDDKSLKLLEFPDVLKVVAGFTSFAASRELALSLRPSADPDRVSLLLKQSAEARRLLVLLPNFSVGSAHDIREEAQLAGLGKILDAAVLLQVRDTLAAARQVRAGLYYLRDRVPHLWDIGQQIVALSDVEADIQRSISDLGEVKDSASKLLTDIRREVLRVHQQLTDRLQAIIRSPRGSSIVQEPIITIREGRYVIPVKIESRRQIRGIVHDVSDSRATVFLEPWATVELGNTWRELKADEEHEVERILRALSQQVGGHQPAISANVELVAQIDLALAKARYAARANATEAMLATDCEAGEALILKLVEARHPLLKGKVVPLSVEIGSDFTGLVVTGPNTGGKTVALKTIGLLAAMTQAGIPIPAADTSTIPVFDGIFADIGDEQSIEQALSSFSWHMGNIIRIIGAATDKSLVLLDELGTATDPNEGSALARAILLHFLSRGAMAVATTHHGDLKAFAHATDGLQNASLDFDSETLSPTYRLSVGYPGGSNAMAIAAQLGLPAHIIDKAKEMLAPGSQQLEVLLADIAREKQQAEALRRDLDRLKTEADRLRNDLSRELQDIKEQKRLLIDGERDRVEAEAIRMQAELREVASELKKAASREKLEEARRTLEAIRQELGASPWQTATQEAQVDVEAPRPLASGDRVWLPDLELWATVVTPPGDGGQVEVQAGDVKLRLQASHVAGAAQPPDTGGRRVEVVKRARPESLPSPELDLRGKRAEEAEAELDRYLNDASLASLAQVRIVHGIGTGVVRRLVRDILRSHPLVKSFAPAGRGQGGDGATIAQL